MDKNVNKFLVKYRELNSLPWKEVDSCGKKNCSVYNLTSSLSYEVKVQCVKDSKCHQCPWSNVAIVPPELTSTPLIEKFDVISQKMGKRLIVAHWKLANSEAVSGYRVEVGKESGEFSQTLSVTKPMLSLILSGSAYYINISAFNSAGTSPSAHRVVPAITNAQDWGLNGNLNITFRSNNTFEISWNHTLTRTYWCYSVEWGLKGEKMSFHPLHRKSSNRDVISLKAPLQPYKRYVFLLHTRPDKDTCNLKSINNSESTNGRTEAYAKEGTPASSPGNITCLVSSTSLALAWKPVPEEDACGFILGYNLYYAENGKGQNSSVVIDDAGANGYTLSDLKSQTAYEVQLSAFTAAGEGARSASFYFETANPGYKAVEGAAAGIVGGVVLLILMANLSFLLCQRAKKVFWPNIPNPGNSNAIQKIDVAFELEVLQPLSREMLAPLEESDTSSLLIIEGIAETLPAPASHLSVPDPDEPSPASSAADQESPSPSQRREPSPTATETVERRAAPPAAVSDYTTMELFQQTMAQPQAPGPGMQAQQTMAQPQAPGPGVQAQQTQQTTAQPQAPGPEVQA
ncbi:interleukin-31 receptor subunit alpha [Anguilla anguilla]|uniref:interleukin-31 receptor subunit alpha n=1 Tax=Anguilla anguilla TaxID=7936 RepID=UPI0015B25B53|nr:interleukin-31 receptor subunit alpha [Anguilla anguilla]